MSQLPFTSEQFLQHLDVYNQTNSPSQLIVYLLGLMALIFNIGTISKKFTVRSQTIINQPENGTS